jgi:hypothetical protein
MIHYSKRVITFTPNLKQNIVKYIKHLTMIEGLVIPDGWMLDKVEDNKIILKKR